ncbi:putative glycosyltransferase [Variovorax paradoxus B4]|uniref:Putative glycosyltransferase n=1 Tax=Variovorax paradoxus B4 TaxID=1246301 RepID=T1X5S8_VARPD|nr:glycosyltransferase [Variovorax paradoxus]AGU47938.1 putative glycosyltransferase [Variovorax paradoxus B4]
MSIEGARETPEAPVANTGAIRQQVSGVVIAYNRIDLIGTCLRALSFVDELLVIDKSSTDGTAELAAQFADRVIVVPWSPVVEETRAFAVATCKHDWIVCMDDDECLSVEAVRFIERELISPRASVYLLPQRHYIMGQHDERAYYWPEFQPRFFSKQAITFLETVHGGMKYDEAAAFVVPYGDGTCIHHLSHKNVEQWIEKANRYTSRLDRVRVPHAGDDVVAFSHENINRYVSVTKSSEPGGYPRAVAVLRALYDIIDRLKTWEEEEGVNGDEAFQTICRQLDAAYARELPTRKIVAPQIDTSQLGAATTPLLAKLPERDATSSDELALETLRRAIEALRESLRHVRAAAELERRNADAVLVHERRLLEENSKQFTIREAELAEEMRANAALHEARLQEVSEGVQLARSELQVHRNKAAVLEQQLVANGTAAEQRLLALQAEADQLRADAASARQQLHAVYASVSWRLTGPMRGIASRHPGAVAGLRGFLRRHPKLRHAAVGTVKAGWRLITLRRVATPVPPPPPPEVELLPALAPSTDVDKHFNVRRIDVDRSVASTPVSAANRRVLCVGHVMPYPPRAGNEYRIHRLLTWLSSAGWSPMVVICPLPHEMPSDQQIAMAASIYPNFIVCGHDGVVHHNLSEDSHLVESLDGEVVRDFGAVLGEQDPAIQRERDLLATMRTFCPDVLIELLLKLDENWKPDVLLAEYVFMTRAFAAMRSELPKVIDTIDVFSTKASKVEQYGVTDGLAMSEAEEAALLNRAQLLIGIQPDECRDLARLAPGRRVVNVGVDFHVNVEAGAAPSKPVVLLVASNNPMNVKGTRDFLRFSWPIIRKERGDVELHIVGDVGRSVAIVPDGVKVLGRFEELDAAYAGAAVVINPTVAGTGLKIKTVEAICQLRPVVAFPAGVDGIGGAAKPLLHVASDWFDFAHHVVRVLSDRPDAATLVELGAALAREFSPEVVYAELAGAIDEL